MNAPLFLSCLAAASIKTVASGRSSWRGADTYPVYGDEFGKPGRREIRPRSRFLEGSPFALGRHGSKSASIALIIHRTQPPLSQLARRVLPPALAIFTLTALHPHSWRLSASLRPGSPAADYGVEPTQGTRHRRRTIGIDAQAGGYPRANGRRWLGQLQY